MRFFASVVFTCAFLLSAGLGSMQAGEAKPAWEREWEETVEAAKKEGQVTIYYTRGPFDKVYADFNKRNPAIKLVSVTGRGGDLIAKIMGERRAGKFLADIYLGSTGTPQDVV